MKLTGFPCAKAFTYRSHSGFFGIINSEEGYQNLSRFLFGDVRVDIWLDIDDIRQPPAVLKEAGNGRSKIKALYQIEIQAAPRGKLWYLSRRTAEKDSGAWQAKYSWQDSGFAPADTVLTANDIAGKAVEIKGNVERSTIDDKGKSQLTSPGISGQLRFIVQSRNQDGQ